MLTSTAMHLKKVANFRDVLQCFIKNMIYSCVKLIFFLLGIFMYGNHFDNIVDNIECMVYPKLMSINNQNFHYSSCNFSERNMYSK